MPTTRAARRAARCLTEVLPADALGLVLYQLTLAHEIAAVAPTCHQLCDAVKLAMKLRPFSGEVVTLATGSEVLCVAAAPDGRIIAGMADHTIQMWRDGACERTIQAHTIFISAVAVLPGGARFVSVSRDRTAKLWAFDGALERTFEMDGYVNCLAALPDGMHFVVGLGYPSSGEVRLYHIDGTHLRGLVHSEGHAVCAVAVTRDGQHIISGAEDKLVKRRSRGTPTSCGRWR